MEELVVTMQLQQDEEGGGGTTCCKVSKIVPTSEKMQGAIITSLSASHIDHDLDLIIHTVWVWKQSIMYTLIKIKQLLKHIR